MIDSPARDTLLRETLLGDDALRECEPPFAALRALRRRRHQRQAVRAFAATAAMVCLLLAGWWSLERGPGTPEPSSPKWVVRTLEMAPADVVHTAFTANIVSTPQNLPQTFVVRSRSGLFESLSDEGLLAMFGDRSPVLIGAPGERHLIFLDDEVRQ